jgi:hypothetical protein
MCSLFKPPPPTSHHSRATFLSDRSPYPAYFRTPAPRFSQQQLLTFSTRHLRPALSLTRCIRGGSGHGAARAAARARDGGAGQGGAAVLPATTGEQRKSQCSKFCPPLRRETKNEWNVEARRVPTFLCLFSPAPPVVSRRRRRLLRVSPHTAKHVVNHPPTSSTPYQPPPPPALRTSNVQRQQKNQKTSNRKTDAQVARRRAGRGGRGRRRAVAAGARQGGAVYKLPTHSLQAAGFNP